MYPARALKRLVLGTVAVSIAATMTVGLVLVSPYWRWPANAFHSSFVDQGPSPTLAPGATTSYTMRFRNTGWAPWQRGGGIGMQVNLGVAGDSTAFADMAVNWFTQNRVATTQEAFVPPGGLGTFTFTALAPSAP